MKKFLWILLVSIALIALGGCTSSKGPAPIEPVNDPALAAQTFQKGGCTACHTIPGVPGAVGTIGPDLTEIGKLAEERLASGEYTGKAKTADEYILEVFTNPDKFISPVCPNGPCQAGTDVRRVGRRI